STNIVEETMGQYYSQLVKSFDPATYRMWGSIVRDHYFLHIEHVTPAVSVIKGNVSTIPTEMTIVIYLPRLSFTLFTNMNIRGSATLSTGQGQLAWFAVNS